MSDVTKWLIKTILFSCLVMVCVVLVLFIPLWLHFLFDMDVVYVRWGMLLSLPLTCFVTYWLIGVVEDKLL